MDATSLWQPTTLAAAVAVLVALATWVGFQHGRRQAEPPPEAPHVASAGAPGFWRDLHSPKGREQTAQVIRGLPEEALEALWSATHEGLSRVKNESSDIDRLFFLANCERERRAKTLALREASREAQRIWTTVLQAATPPRAAPAPAPPPRTP